MQFFFEYMIVFNNYKIFKIKLQFKFLYLLMQI